MFFAIRDVGVSGCSFTTGTEIRPALYSTIYEYIFTTIVLKHRVLDDMA